MLGCTRWGADVQFGCAWYMLGRILECKKSISYGPPYHVFCNVGNQLLCGPVPNVCLLEVKIVTVTVDPGSSSHALAISVQCGEFVLGQSYPCNLASRGLHGSYLLRMYASVHHPDN